jgi:hypothetical protein
MSGDGQLNQDGAKDTNLSSTVGTGIRNSALENADMPSRETITAISSSLEVKENNGVTKTVNLDGSVTYEGYGIKGTVK